MKNKLLIIFLISIINIHSQEIKTYSGKYENGKAIYKYYENKNYKRIYHGKFTYEKLPEYSSNQIIKIEGQFKNNLKEGVWLYLSNKNEKKLTIQGSYKLNLKNGIWTFQKSEPNNNRSTYFLEFKNDTIINSFNLKDVRGQFDKTGNFIGKWNINQLEEESILEFENNILTKLIFRKISTGKLYTKYTPEIDSINLDKRKTQNINNIFSVSNDYGIKVGIQNFKKKLDNEIYALLRLSKNDALNFIFLDDIKVQSFSYISRHKNEEVSINQSSTSNQGNIEGNPYANAYYGGGSGNGSGYGLNGRKVISFKKHIQNCNEEGKVVAKIFVNKKGNVIKVNIQQSDDPCLNSSAKKTAKSYIFDETPSAPEIQTGFIIIHYSLGE